jgi:ATP-dependent DNA helicase RecG
LQSQRRWIPALGHRPQRAPTQRDAGEHRLLHATVRVRSHLIDFVRDGDANDHLLVFEIDASDVVHASVKDVVYLRVGDENRRLSFSRRQALLFDKAQASYEIRAVASADLSELDVDLLPADAEAVRAPDAGRLLQTRACRMARVSR